MDQQTKDPDVLNVLVLERVDRTKNMARYYVLSVEPTLFAELSLVRRWGRIGGAGRTRIDLHASPPLAQISAQHMARTQAAPRLPTPRLIAGSRLFAGVLLRPRRIRNAESARWANHASFRISRRRERAFVSETRSLGNSPTLGQARFCRYRWLVDGRSGPGVGGMFIQDEE